MDRIIGLLLFALLVGCAQPVSQAPDVINGSSAQSARLDGAATAAYLTTLYGRQLANCNEVDSKPAFLCSGVMFRVTDKDPNNTYKVWDPSPTSIKNGGVNFSYLRADTNFDKFAWDKTNSNGYILYPVLERPANTDQLKVLCSYPMDSYGWHRSATAVCVAHPSYPNSGHCQDAGITTGEQFKNAWSSAPGDQNRRQCDFDVRDERNRLAGPAFYQSLRAKSLLGATGFSQWNDILVKTWAAGKPNALPILAFYYSPAKNDPKALADAQYNQRDFYNSTNPKIVVPIIRVALPTVLTGKATFTYVAADQAITQ
ncbi:halovibrin HvnC [Pseudomonas fluorescens]|uniref:Halovibrin HvnC n=1 Tax=Pseudomonas fluorescens TaxID=294 RepID=A0A423LMK7_PSEFL|nr:halovibrin HvnC [Pseudomonas fluorescens]RON69572.1 halovibrin HvnC [Pseudomonas fluorescens]